MARRDVKITIRGAGALKQKLTALAAVGDGKYLTTALVAGAQPIQAEAKRRVPYRSGTLSRSITTRVVEQSQYRVRVVVGTNVVYARIHEFGGTITPKRSTWLWWQDDNGVWHRAKKVVLPARPYFRPAFDTQKGAAMQEIKAALKQLIRQVVA